jgi:hypothetical protein
MGMVRGGGANLLGMQTDREAEAGATGNEQRCREGMVPGRTGKPPKKRE